MDNIFGVGLPELILILVIAGMVMGPERIVRAARTLGVLTAKLQSISRSFLRQIDAELDGVDDTGQVKGTVEELNQIRREMTELRDELYTLATGAAVGSRQLSSGARREAENSIQPPDMASKSAAKRSKRVTPTPAARPAANGDTAADKPASPASRHIALPKRLDIPEDPEE